MRLKSYKDYINEASLDANPGVPKKFLADTKREGEQAANNFKRTNFRDLVGMRQNVERVRALQSGYEEELEKIAEETIRNSYGSILDGVDLIIKFPERGEIKKMMKDTPDDEDDNDQTEDVKLTNQSTIDEINKRKILKNIMQGEAKNSKRMLNLPEVRDRITGLMGEREGNEYLDLLNRIIAAASIQDWDVPLEIQKDMWQRNSVMGEFAGAVKVSWEDNEEPESDEDIANRILADLEVGEDIPEETGELFNNATPTIHALGLDFAMLIHETIKGIYNLIISLSIPTDQSVSETVIMNTDTLADELEDLRYGPVFAAKLRDFINEFPESDKIENLREHVVGKLSLLPAEEFLAFMLMFLNGEAGAKSKMGKIINEIKKDFSDYEIDSRNQKREEDIDSNSEIDALIAGAQKDDSEDNTGTITDYELKMMSNKEIIKLMDDALDAEDQKEYERLAKFLKESRNYEYL